MPENTAFWMQNPVARSFLITDRFNSSRTYGNGKHEGIDLAATDSSGNPVAVLAAQRGIVTKTASIPTGYGTYVIIKHEWPDGNVYMTWYGHMSKIEVRTGDFVNTGQRIGIAGSTGNSTGIHLHLTLQHIGHGLSGYVVTDVVDPIPYFLETAPKLREASFLADETVPDGTIFQPGTFFLKTWRLRNSGTLSWGSGCELTFLSGEKLSAPDSVPLPNVGLGQDALVSIPMIAPSAHGRYRSYWKPRDQSGDFFEMVLWAEIVVAGTAVQDNSKLVEDLLIAEGETLKIGQTFIKEWKVVNCGTSIWNSEFRLSFIDGDQMGGNDSVSMPYMKPGEEAIVSVSLKAPGKAGSYRGAWQLRNASGQGFGEIFPVCVKVEDDTAFGLLDELTFIDDLTFEDGTRVEPGQAIHKIWRVRNSGQSTWASGYILKFSEHHKMSAPDSIPLPELSPGEIADISLLFKAPVAPGEYLSMWAPTNTNGETFLAELYLKIEVIESINRGDLIDNSKFEQDITIPDGTTVQAGATFLKTWRIRNTGSTTWTSNYSISFLGDNSMGAMDDQALLVTVDPGGLLDVSVNLVAPLTPGTHKSIWCLKNSVGEFFGHSLFALIKVPAPTPALLQSKAQFVWHETYELGTRVQRGQTIEKIWRVRNIGESTWGEGFTLAFIDGAKMGGPNSVSIPLTIPGQTSRIRVNIKAPTSPGSYRGYWRLRDSRGVFFGPRLPIWIKVK
jgi:hypothetical protein